MTTAKKSLADEGTTPTMNTFRTIRTIQHRAASRRLALVAAAAALCVLPAAAFPARAAAQQQDKSPATEPAAASRLTGITLPDGAMRLTDNALAGELVC